MWASSDALLAQLNADPQTILRRLGDGFYEQRLVTEQIMAATGQRYIGDYRDTEAQYIALLNAGAEFAQTHSLRLGVALTEAQMRLLTTDMVWLVAQTVTLPNGQTERVLAPQLYVRVAEGDLRTDGTLMAGSTVKMQLQGDLTNSGAIYGRQVADIRADNIGNSGRIASGDLTLLTARQDIDSTGAIDGARIGIDAGRDVNVTTQTSTSTGKNTSRTSVDRVASINAGQLLMVTSGRDITLTGAQVNSGGALVLDAKRDLNLATVNVAESINIAWDAKNRLSTSNSAEIVSSIKAGGDITLNAGQDLNARAAYVSSDSGAISATAERDIVITNGMATSAFEEDRYVEKKSNGIGPSGSMLSRRTSSARSTTEHSAGSAEQVQGSTFSAERISMSSGRDLTVQGSSIVATNDVSLDAKRDLTITSAEQSSSSEQSKDEQRSGAGAMGGLSNGKKRVEQANTSASTTQVGSSIGSLQGNVSLTAGNDYRQTASDVRALGLRDKDGNLLQGGDIAISGANVTIDTAENTSTASQDLRMRQSGVSVTFSSPIVNALQGMVQTIDAAGQTNDSRTQALAAASTVMAATNLASSVATASALNISVSVGNSRSQSHSEQSGSMAATSTVEAGGNLTIKATGKEPGQGNLTAIGANLSAGNDATLDATNDIELRAAQNSATQSSTNRSSSASVGIGIALGGTQNGITINAAASQARGNANGTDTTNTLTTVSAGNTLTINSGRDTNLIGAVASGNSVTATVGGNLNIESVQDTSTYTSRQQSAGVGVSLCIPPICYGASSASVSLANSRVNGDFASVTTQSGIRAGDGGFNLNVGGNTNLTGAAITSSQAAVDAGKNSLSTDTITQSEIRNGDTYNANSIAVSASYSSARQEYNPDTDQAQTARNPDGSLSRSSTGQGIGVGSASGSQRSATGNAISGATVTIRSGDDKALAGIDRTAVTEISIANTLTRNWDGQTLAQNVTLQAQLTQSLSQAAPRAVADFAQGRINSLNEQARIANDAGDSTRAQELKDEAARWAEGGVYRVAAHTTVGLLLGGADGALGAGASATAAPLIDQLQSNVQARLQDAGMSPQAAQAASALIGTGAATLVGAAAGGGNVSAAAMAFNVDANNRQLHPSERRRIGEMARRQAQGTCREGDAACIQNNTLYWTDMLERAASGRVDDDKAAANNGYYGQVIDAAGRPSSEGSLGASVRFFNDLEAAQRLLNTDAGAPILDNQGRPVLGTDGRPQTFFGATAEQRANPYGNALLGQMPTSIIPGKDNRDADRLDYLNARNGSAIPVYPVEEVVLGGAVGNRAVATVGRVIDAAAARAAADEAAAALLDAAVVPGRVQSRINVANGQTATTPLRPSTGEPVSAGFNHVVEGHFDRPLAANRSIFTITPDELKAVLQSPSAVASPVTPLEGGQYMRIVDTRIVVGNASLNEGGLPTTFIKIFTDAAGNLISTYPVRGTKG